MRCGALLSLMLVCGCGLETVEECVPNCVLDAGPSRRDGGLNDAGRADAGSFDAGPGDAGSTDAGSTDAGSTDTDAGSTDTDAGSIDAGPIDAGPIDAGPIDAGPCMAAVLAYAPLRRDVIRVEGTAGSLGAVDYVLGGTSAGYWADNGIQRFTNRQVGNAGAPIQDTGLWVWANGPEARTGVDYVGNNLNQSNGGTPFINFRIYPGITCGPGQGQGSFNFTSFRTPTMPGSTPIEGFFEFHCPSAGIDVRGCFHYSGT